MLAKSGIALIILGVVLSAVFASFIPIDWTNFAIAVWVLIVGILLQRKGAKEEMKSETGKELSLNKFREKIIELKKEISHYAENVSEKDVSIIDDRISDVLPEVENYRFSIVNEIGIGGYTELISVYAKAERLIGRGVSATIDEYFDEAKKYFSDAVVLLEATIQRIEKQSRERVQ